MRSRAGDKKPPHAPGAAEPHLGCGAVPRDTVCPLPMGRGSPLPSAARGMRVPAALPAASSAYGTGDEQHLAVVESVPDEAAGRRSPDKRRRSSHSP